MKAVDSVPAMSKAMRSRVIFATAAGAILASAAIAITAAHMTTPAPMTPGAKAYLDRTIALFRAQHINSSKMDWPALTRKAYATAAGAQTTADTYPAIRLIIEELGEKHTVFIEPDQAKADLTGKASGNAQPPPLLLPEAMRVGKGVGLVRLYAFIGSAAQGEAYARTAQTKINALKQQGVCRFILDLREDTGGNMYPMLNGIAALLEPGLLGTFQTAQGKYMPWALRDGAVVVLPPQDTVPIATGNHAALPVAVVIGPHTGSSGEFTAMSFEGRANTRFFGAPSAGYVTGNVPIPLSDGALILMTGSWALDRTGKKYLDRIEPDEEIGPFGELTGNGAVDSAVKWLSAQPCPQSPVRNAMRR